MARNAFEGYQEIADRNIEQPKGAEIFTSEDYEAGEIEANLKKMKMNEKMINTTTINRDKL